MSTIEIKVLDVQETVCYLREKLGPVYDWNNRLDDMRRGKISKGPVLLPIGLRKHARRWRPVYEPRAIVTFVIQFEKYDDRARCGVPMSTMKAIIDPAHAIPWFYRKLECEASPQPSASPV